MKFLNYIRTVPFYLNVALFVAVISILLIDFYFKYIPEVFQWGSELGKIYYKLCLSLIASYIFYFIVVHIKSIKDKENVNIFIANKVSNILNEYTSQIKSLKKEISDESEILYFELHNLENMFEKIDPKSNAPLILGNINNYANWMQFFSYYNKKSQEHIQKVFVHMPFLDSELVKILAHIDDCSHFSIIDLLLNIKFGNDNLKSFASSFYGYSTLCKELDNYYNKKLLKYTKIK